jgi:diguanylate cyclase (GGDEF)-like protein
MYYRSFLALVVFPLLIVIGVAIFVLRANTLESARDRIRLAQNSITATLTQDVGSAIMELNHLLETGNGRLREMSSAVLTEIGRDNSEAADALREFYGLVIPPGLNIAAVHFYAKNGTYFNLGEPIANNLGVRIRDVRAMQFYTDALESPGRVLVDFVLPGHIIDTRRPLIAAAFAVTPGDPDDLTEVICLYMHTRAYSLLQNFSEASNQGEIYLLNMNSEVVMSPAGTTAQRPLYNIPWSNGVHPLNLAEGGSFNCIVHVIRDADLEYDMKIVSMINDNILLQDFNTLALIVISISILLFTSYILFSRNFLKNIVRPLHRLMSGMERMDEKMENSEVKIFVEPSGQHEMRDLIESFNDMAAHIGDLMRIKEGIFKASPIGLMMFDDQYNFIDCNATMLNMLNTTQNYYFSNYRELLPEYQHDGTKSRDKFKEIMKWALNGETVVTEWQFISQEKEPVPCEITLSRTERDGKYVGLGFVYDLRSIKAMEQNIQTLESEVDKIYYDALTGIYNRRYFDKQLDMLIKILSRSPAGSLSLMMIDIDCFKPYNDTYGHSQGDEALRIVARTLKESVTRADDFVVRYGGEEFSVVLPNTDEAGARLVADLLLNNIRKHRLIHEATNVEGVEYITISIGIATGDVHHTQTPEDYIKYADTMLYHAKISFGCGC